MRVDRFILFIAAGVILGTPVAGIGRPIKIRSYAELTKAADVIVIAAATSTRDANPSNKPMSTDQRDDWVPVNTTFKSLAALKGAVGNIMVLRHYRHSNKNAKTVIVNGPGFVTFDTSGKTQYLLFLKSAPSGLFEPVTGQMDPWLSIRILQTYSEPKPVLSTTQPANPRQKDSPP